MGKKSQSSQKLVIQSDNEVGKTWNSIYQEKKKMQIFKAKH